MTGPDLISLEIMTEGLVSIVREMRQTVLRTAHSPVISEAQDFSCALFNPRGEMVAQSRDMPGHVIAMPASVAEAMKDFGDGLAPGDVVIVNDPYRGGSHLNDVTVICPVFVEAELFVFPCVRMHWADIGGMTPGSISGSATEILQEGVRIPPIKLVEQGRENHAAATLLFANVRSAEERRGDLDACFAACRTAERRLHAFAKRYGQSETLAVTDANIERTEARLRRLIAELPDGTYRYEDSIDLYSDGLYDPVLVTCALSVDGDEITADFSGSNPQVDAVVNASRAMTQAGVFIAVKSVLDPGGMINSGAFRPIHVVTPAASVVDVAFPAPANAHSEVRKRVLSTVMGAMAQIVPDRVTADQCGTTFQNLLGGYDPAFGGGFLYYDYPPGGNGGFDESDGPDAMNPVDLGDISTVQPVEILETTAPVRVDSCGFRLDSGGAGRRRGGMAAERETRLLAASGSYSVQSDRAIVPPYGMGIGQAGAPTETFFRRGDKKVDFATPGKVAGAQARRDDVLVMKAAGGGGWGDPLDREPDLVLTDLLEGLISVDQARDVYGVELANETQVDVEATAARRATLKSSRLYLTLATLPAERAFAGNRGKHRRAEISEQTAADRGLAPGSLIELFGRHPAPLRAWIYIGSSPDDTIALASDALAILGADTGESVLVRPIPTAQRVF